MNKHVHTQNSQREGKQISPYLVLLRSHLASFCPQSSQQLSYVFWTWNTYTTLIWGTMLKGNKHFSKPAFTNHVILEKLFLFIFTVRATTAAAPSSTLWWRLPPHHKYAFHFLVRSYRNKTELVLHAELHTDLPEKIASQQNENDEDQKQNQHWSQ